ncbi:MAG: hypothetical protein AAGK09_03825 [Planctomycetota bacterium]
MVALGLVVSGVTLAEPHTGDPDESFAPEGYVLAWEDDFNQGSLDHSKWFYRDGIDRGRTLLSRDNVILDHGVLNLVCQPGTFKIDRASYARYRGDQDTFHYKSAGIISDWRFSEGYFETRSLMLSAPYWHPAFWLEVVSAGENDHLLGFYNVSEIDIMECEPQWPVAQSLRIHDFVTGGEHRKLPPKDESVGHNMTIASDQSLGWFVWSLKLTREQAIFYENGKHILTVDIPDDYRRDARNIILSCVTIKEPTESGIQQFDWVRYHEPVALRENPVKECENLIQRTSLVRDAIQDVFDDGASDGIYRRTIGARPGDEITFRIYITEPGTQRIALRTFSDDEPAGAWQLTIDGKPVAEPIVPGPQPGFAEWDLGDVPIDAEGYHDFQLTCVDAEPGGATVGFDAITISKR